MMNEYMGDMAGRGTVQLPYPARHVTAEVTGDFTLPDYQPEIKKLLRIGVNLLPPDPHRGGSDLMGSMDYYVLYVGMDGGVYCAPLSTEYRLEANGEGAMTGLPEAMGEPTIYLCDLSSEVPVGRVVSPRRLHIRCKVKARVRAYGECPPGPWDGGEVDSTVETLTTEVPVGRLYQALGEPLTLGDDVILSPAEGEMRVVCAEGQVMVTEAIPASGTVNCRGEVTVKLTLCPAETVGDMLAELTGDTEEKQPPRLIILKRKIPFSQTLGMEGVTSACAATACGYCSEITVSMDDGRLHLDVGVVTEVRAQQNETVTCVADLYSTRREGACRYADYPAEVGQRALNGNFTLSDSLPLAEAGVDPAARVVDVTADGAALMESGIPVTVLLLVFFYIIFVSEKDGVPVAIIAFGINSGAYVAEIFRSGIMSVDGGQFEAGRSLGFNYLQTMIYIIIPQAFKTILPTLCNEFIVLFKETSVAGYVGIMDLTKAGELIRGRTFKAFMPLIAVAIVYLVWVMALTYFVGLLERRLRKNER